MYNLPINIYIFLIFLFFQGFLVLLVLYMFLEKLAGSSKRKREELLIKDEAHAKALQFLSDAQVQSAKIIKDAEVNASQIIANAEYVSKAMKDNLDRVVKDTVNQSTVKFEALLHQSNEEFMTAFSSEKTTLLADFEHVIKDVKSELIKGTEAFNTSLSNATAEYASDLRKKESDQLQAMQARISDYEQKTKKHIEAKLFDILSDALTEITGEAIPLEKHEDLVISSLAELDFSDNSTDIN